MTHSPKSNVETTSMTDTPWLVFFPQTPATPSSLRVLVWRRLQHAGAIHLQSGAWMLPETNEHKQVLQTLLTEMERQGGGGFYLEARVPPAGVQAAIVKRFQDERGKEYQEFSERCQEFLAEVEKETRARKFTFAELEENEHDLLKLNRWLRKIHRRDFFPGSQSQEAGRHLAICHQVLETFTAAVYEQEGLSQPSTGAILPPGLDMQEEQESEE